MSYNAELIPEILGPRGPLSSELGSYEDRPYQREFALEVARLLEEGGRLAAEAPTGIGKSLGYGVPAAMWAAAGHGPVVISTHTKALQQQLLIQESPRLRRVAGDQLRVEVLKGRANYLCRRRYEAARAEAGSAGTISLLDRLKPWVESTETGDWTTCKEQNPADLRFLMLRVAGDARFCANSKCTPEDGCFFKRARARATTSDLLVVNHALLAIHLFGGYDILPPADAWIVDEAHGFIRVALDHLTISVSPGRVLSVLEKEPSAGGFVPSVLRDGEGSSHLAALHRSSGKLETEARNFFSSKNGGASKGDDRRRYRDAEGFQNLCPVSPESFSDALGTVIADSRTLLAFLDGDAEGDEPGAAFAAGIRRFREDLQQLQLDFHDLLNPDPNDRDHVTWKEWGRDHSFSLSTSPLEIGPRLSSALSEGPRTLVFTSATLAAGKSFSYFAREVGMQDSLPGVVYPSPFSFERQAVVLAVRNAPDPRDSSWAESTARTLDAMLRDPGRKTMALFTSYRDLEAVRDGLESLAEEGGEKAQYAVLAQGQSAPAATLLEWFRESDRAVLLGTASFWEGVDLPGDDLEVLVLTRLPFGVPTDPRYLARAERLESEGGNAFMDLYLPEAVLRFKQGFGRLIRRRSDRGIVAVLDPRLLGKGYGRRFAGALPLPIQAVANGTALAEAAARWWAAGGEGEL